MQDYKTNTKDRFEKERGVCNHFAVQGSSEKCSSLLPPGTSCPETGQGKMNVWSCWPPAWSFIPWITLPFLPFGLSSNTRENGEVEVFPKHGLSKAAALWFLFFFGLCHKGALCISKLQTICTFLKFWLRTSKKILSICWSIIKPEKKIA